MAMLPDIVIYLLYALLAGAAAMDLWRLRIPNFFPLAIVALYFVWFGIHVPFAGVWQNALMFAFTLAGSTFLFTRGWLGGGDAKLLAAIALWFDFTGGAGLYFYVAIGGGLLSLIFILLRRMVPAQLAESTTAAALKPRGPIPYGIAIAGGAALAILGGGTNPDPAPKQLVFHYAPGPPAQAR
jgi:prepilin peptidase CpaA